MSRLSLPTADAAQFRARFRARLGGGAGRWVPRAFTLLVWGGVAACAAYWFLTLGSQPQAVPAHAQVTGLESTLRGDLTRLFGQPPSGGALPAAAPAAASRFKVIGVIGSVRGGPGVALLSIDGKAPKAYAVGSVVDGDWVLQSVTQTSVRIGPQQGSDGIELAIAKMPPATTGQLPGTEGMVEAGTAARPFVLPPGQQMQGVGGAPQAPPIPQQMPSVVQPESPPASAPGG